MQNQMQPVELLGEAVCNSQEKNASEIWKSKSLDSKPTEKYEIRKKLKDYDGKKKTKKEDEEEPVTTGGETLPEPKITKINENTFCVHLSNLLSVFQCISDGEKSLKRKETGTFRKSQYDPFPEDIQFVVGNNSDYIYVGLSNQLHILRSNYKTQYSEEGKMMQLCNGVQFITKIAVEKMRFVTFTETTKPKEIIIISRDKIYRYAQENFNLTSEENLNFDKPEDLENYRKISPFAFVNEKDECLYMLGTYQDLKQTETADGPEKKLQEFLCVVSFECRTKKATFYEVDQIFGLDLFHKSKVFYLDHEVFLVSLYEEIIVVKKNHKKFVIWDNISIVPAKNQKKGQLVLADKIVWVYTEKGQIFAHNIFFPADEKILVFPEIDNFRGNDNDEDILYDALVFEYKPGTFMKVLFYFKEHEVLLPPDSDSPSIGMRKVEKKEGDHKNQNMLSFIALCIQQTDPESKLVDLLKAKKLPAEINKFVERYKISKLTKSKSQWRVSDKKQKDIIGLLLAIQHNEYIQEELTAILKSQPHEIKFLKNIQEKQRQRYETMLVKQLLKYDQKSDPIGFVKRAEKEPYTKNEKTDIKMTIQWVLQSIMFRKKLQYSSMFLTFKEYSFIEIGKLKAASLREEIKLLSQKGFQQRLIYFLNTFKYMALDNFEEIFTFLLGDKSQKEILQFFTRNFKFILPQFQEPSEIFRQKLISEQYLVEGSHSLDVVVTQTISEKCKLWDQDFDEKKIQTKENFQNNILRLLSQQYYSKQSQQKAPGVNLQVASEYFKLIFQEFMEEDWFKKNKSKQHSILDHKIDQLKREFVKLKEIGVFHILIKLLYKKIDEPPKLFKQPEIDNMLEQFHKAKLIPESFKCNIIARKQVFKVLNEIVSKTRVQCQLYKRHQFLILDESEYFEYLFNHFRGFLLVEIKKIYDDIEKGFFREKFQIYLNCESKIKLASMVDFIDSFEEKGEIKSKVEAKSEKDKEDEKNENEKIRELVFRCIKNILKISDKANTETLVQKLLDKEILRKQENSTPESENLIDQAKVAFSFYFYNFFKLFQLQEYTYKDLIDFIQETDFQKNEFMRTILVQYSEGDLNYEKIVPSHSFIEENDEFESHKVLQLIRFEKNDYGLEEMNDIEISNPCVFFGIMLYIIDTLRFKIPFIKIFDEMVWLYLERQAHEDLHSFIDDLILFEDSDESPNQTLISDFIKEYQIKTKMTDCVIRWIKHQYRSVQKNQKVTKEYEMKLAHKFQEIQHIFQTLQSKLEGTEIAREAQFLKMLQQILKLNSQLLTYIIPKRFENVKIVQKFDRQYETCPLFDELSIFNFMMDLRKNIKDKFYEKVNQNVINGELYIMELISLCISHISSVPSNRETETAQFQLHRFKTELAKYLIEKDKFEYSRETTNSSIDMRYDFRDIFYQFFACMKCDSKNYRKKLQIFIKEFIQLKSKSQIKKKVQAFLSQNSICSFQPKKERRDITQLVFRSILQSNNSLNEAFYFLIRAQQFPIDNAKFIAYNTLSKYQIKTRILTYALLASYVKNLQKHLYVDFYPTMKFFSEKYDHLSEKESRKDTIKDINICISRLNEFINILKELIAKNNKSQITKYHDLIEELTPETYEQKKINISYDLKELEGIYVEYMKEIGLNPVIQLNETPEELQTKNKEMEYFSSQHLQHRGQVASYMQNSEIVQEQDEEEGILLNLPQEDMLKKEKERQRQKEKYEVLFQEAKEKNKFRSIQQEINQKYHETENEIEKFQKMHEESKKFKAPSMTKHFEEYDKIEEKRNEELQSVKSNFHSKATQNAKKLIEQSRKRRSEMNSKNSIYSHSKFEKVEIQSQKSEPNPFKFIVPNKEESIENSRKYEVVVHSAKKQPDSFFPITSSQNKKIEREPQEMSEKLQKMKIQAKNRMVAPSTSRKSLTSNYENILRLFEQQEPQCKKLFEKLENVHTNLELAVSITRNIYNSIKSFKIFVNYLGYLLESNPEYKKIFEERAYKIASQAMSIQVKVNLKELFPIELFINKQNVSKKQFYEIAYNLMRPNLMKIMKKTDCNIHGLAILYRFGFGSENLYYNKVYEDHLRVLIQDYAMKKNQQKKVFFLAQKIRSNFGNLNPENRGGILQSLLEEIGDEEKKKELVKEIMKGERSGDRGNMELKASLQRMY